MRRCLLLFLCLLLVFIVFLSIPQEICANGYDVSYIVTVEPEVAGKVEVSLQNIDVSSIIFVIPEKIENVSVEYIENFKNFTANDSNGNELPVRKLHNGWSVTVKDLSDINVSYEFGTSFKEESGRMRDIVRLDENMLFFLNRAVFLIPQIEVNDIKVKFNIPDNWSVGTHFVPLGNNEFLVEKKPTLEDDFLYNVTVLGILDYQVEKEIDKITYVFSVFDTIHHNSGLIEFWNHWDGRYDQSKIEQYMLEYIDLIGFSVRYFTDLFGYWPGGSRYHIIAGIVEESKVHSITGFQHYIFSCERRRQPDAPHHVAHAWIWWNEDSIKLNEKELQLILEGVPMYYQAEAMQRFYGDEMWLGLHYVQHLIVKRANHFNILDYRNISVYSLSHMQILALDREIRENTNNTKNIEDVLSLIGERFGVEEKAMSRQDLINVINDVANDDMSDFYNDYLAGHLPRKTPPTSTFIDEYQEQFFKWLDSYPVLHDVFNADHADKAEFSRTMLLIYLEIMIHQDSAFDVLGRTAPHKIYDFAEIMKNYDLPLTEADIVDGLTKTTGVDQGDFFEFYTVGEWRPSVEDVEVWLHGHLVNISKKGEGSISPKVGIIPVKKDGIITLTASPDPGWQFEGWDINNYSLEKNETFELIVDQPVIVVALFSNVAATSNQEEDKNSTPSSNSNIREGDIMTIFFTTLGILIIAVIFVIIKRKNKSI